MTINGFGNEFWIDLLQNTKIEAVQQEKLLEKICIIAASLLQQLKT